MLDPQLEALSVDERLKLIEELWVSIASGPEAFALSQEQEEELDRREEELKRDPDSAIPWDEVRKRLSKS